MLPSRRFSRDFKLHGVQQNEIKFGLDEYPAPEDVSVLRLYGMPFDPACRRIQ